MNEPAIRLEEQIISLFPGMETFVCHGWILKKMERHFWIYPLYHRFSGENISESIQRCEEISRRSGRECVFRIVEHTNYYLSSILTDNGYVLWKCGIVGELYLPDDESRLRRGEPGRELLFLPDGDLPENMVLEDIVRSATAHGIKKILADIPETEELPEEYKQAGFNRSYLYRCYQKQEEKSSKEQEEKSSQKQED